MEEKWKDGDILINKGRTEYTIFKGYSTITIPVKYSIFKGYSYGTIFYTYSFSIRIDKEDIIRYRSNEGENLYENEDFRLATSEEVEQFHNILHKYHKEWDAKKKKLVDWKWKPKEDDSYYCIETDGEVACNTWYGDSFDADCYNFGNCFRTEEEAKAMLKKVKLLFNKE